MTAPNVRNWLDSQQCVEFKLTEVEKAELRSFRGHDIQYQQGADERKKANDARILEIQIAFVKAEEKLEEDLLSNLLIDIRLHGVSETRRTACPAYMFTMFLDLPVEIQNHIWQQAAFSEPSKMHYVASMLCERSLDRQYRTNMSSSRILCSEETLALPVPSILTASLSSRLEASKYLTLLQTSRMLRDEGGYNAMYLNTHSDVFYCAESPWRSFKFMLDIVALRQKRLHVFPDVGQELDSLLKVRHLAMDFTDWTRTPPILWTHFSALKTLILVIYPYRSFLQRPVFTIVPGGNAEDTCKFYDPSAFPTFRKRQEWILEAARDKLMKNHGSLPKWKLPKIEVLVRRCDRVDNRFAVPSMPEIVGKLDQDEEFWWIYDNPNANQELDELPMAEVDIHEGSHPYMIPRVKRRPRDDGIHALELPWYEEAASMLMETHVVNENCISQHMWVALYPEEGT